MLGALVTALVAVAGAAVYVATTEETLPPKPDIPLDAWVPYWTLDDALPDIGRRGGSMREVSPFWFTAVGVDEIAVDPNASAEATGAFMEALRRTGADVVPSIVDLLPAGEMAAIIADPEPEHVTSRRSDDSPPTATTTASTSTTSSSPSPTVGTRGRRPGPTGWRSSRNSGPISARTVARSS